ncbi:hypothetical protein [Kitasatospora cathayae]|uniref:DUF4158 domain-containing protein n=1 Tax=Kitasatospora cathayae TaxID=3004092 RepID=A0ABY7QIN1_9ACTN|nr:hypothetical protein [Kitasatospora sp. HUAS 3-15]WBP92110.1 hypothetical protein O1G21_40530 [Kitasatospora sp. HUAS 3-15]
MGRQPVGMDELVEHWTVLDDEVDLVAGKRGGTRVGFALLLKFYTRHGRFPRGRMDFADVAPRVLTGWRQRAVVESPSHLRRRSPESAVTLLAALLVEREREVTDCLVDLLIATVHRIGARAEQKVTNELINAFKRVSGKENLLFQIAEASLAEPGGEVREVVFPAVRGGEQTLKELVHEYRTKGPVYRRTVQTTLRASYTNTGPCSTRSPWSSGTRRLGTPPITRWARAPPSTAAPRGSGPICSARPTGAA